MVNVFEDKISQGHTPSPPPMMKNVCVSQSFRYEILLTIHKWHIQYFSMAVSTDIYLSHDISYPFRTIGNVPLETSATFFMT